ncbi:MAG: hypothetical protein BM560_00050 [Roseobacter sp. MedPE-SWde]|nr:MAG: hypothetical protein BM560_00050 [Roseobacter sp. MedPE-SWde]
MEVIKDAFDAFSDRIRSPFVGSILLAFCFWNWKPLWYLLFEEATVTERIAFFEGNSNTSSLLVLPIFSGMAAALALPWLRYVGAEIAKYPNARLKTLQAEEARQRRIALIKASKEEEQAQSDLRVAKIDMTLAEEKALIALEAAKADAKRDAQAKQEQATLEAAKRLDEARSLGAEVEGELQEQREALSSSAPAVPPVEQITSLPFAEEILKTAAQSEDGRFFQTGPQINVTVKGGMSRERGRVSLGKDHQDGLEITDTIETLTKEGLLVDLGRSPNETWNYYEITKIGYHLLDELSANAKPSTEPHSLEVPVGKTVVEGLKEVSSKE